MISKSSFCEFNNLYQCNLMSFSDKCYLYWTILNNSIIWNNSDFFSDLLQHIGIIESYFSFDFHYKVRNIFWGKKYSLSWKDLVKGLCCSWFSNVPGSYLFCFQCSPHFLGSFLIVHHITPKSQWFIWCHAFLRAYDART